MKKYLLSLAALMLLGSLAHSQEADDLGNYAEFSIIPRLDLNPVFSPEGNEFGLGNSSLYTLFEGSASEHFSWTVANHWFNGYSLVCAEPDPWEMFKSLGKSDTNNWIDMLYADLSFGGWTFTLGKQCITTGGHEYSDWDWEVHPVLASPLWNGLTCYQWGGKAAWTTPSEMTTLSLQMTTSPFGERPFASGLWTYSFQWSGEYGWYSPLWSVSLFEMPGKAYGSAPKNLQWLVSLGNQFRFGDWTVTLDWSNTAGLVEEYEGFLKGHSFHARIDWAPSERVDLSLRSNVVVDKHPRWIDDWHRASYCNLGAALHFYPIPGSKDFRVHALAAYNFTSRQVDLNIGLLYNIRFNLW